MKAHRLWAFITYYLLEIQKIPNFILKITKLNIFNENRKTSQVPIHQEGLNAVLQKKRLLN